MQHLRRTLIRYSRQAGPVISAVATIFVGGLGLQAAGNWHRHSEPGANFFHLHFHVGDHQHPADDDHDRDTPADRKQKRNVVLTVVLALQDNAAAPAVAPPEPAPDRTAIDGVDLPRFGKPPSFAKPRAPPI